MCAQLLRDVVVVVTKTLPRLETREDLMILLEVGRYQEAGIPLTVKALTMSGLGAPATVARRLRRLIEQKMIAKRQGKFDGRHMHLVLTATARRGIDRAVREIDQVVNGEANRRRIGMRSSRARHLSAQPKDEDRERSS
jgi:DNA-binding MarR family transcriptional regulator